VSQQSTAKTIKEMVRITKAKMRHKVKQRYNVCF
jgi:hypothetical protein